ncbi:hypothetical protein V5799_004684 [Amblyomma americanum]|uniref:ABC transporter domain-containing protein n=1 Tax=Amblyomma americanum TaxID=6943 RepID=A0AAQ4D5E3_AMBAM
MDPETRRNVWDTLQNVAKERTLVLSSHDMDEADAIGDQVVIMASGKVICSGSTAFLKKACGVGYKITLVKDPKVFKLKEVLAVVEKAVPTATVEDEKKGEVTIALKTLDYKSFPAMFGTLEGTSKKLGIAKIGVSVASMKDVYLKINMDWAPEGKAQESPVEKKDIDAVVAPITKQRTAVRVFIALFIKRFFSLIRSWGILLGFVLLPLGLLALIGWQQPLPSLASQQESAGMTKAIPLSFGAHYSGSPVVVGESPATKLSETLRILMESEGASVRKTTDVGKELGPIAKEDFHRYISTYPMAVGFKNDNITLMQNPTSSISLPILLNLVTTAKLREVLAQPLAHISASIAFITGKYKSAGVAIIQYRVQVWLYWAVLPALSYSLAFAIYAVFPVPERLGGGRDVQIMTGMSGVEFVFAHLVFDMIYHALLSGCWVLVHFAFSEYSANTAGNYYLAFLLSGPAFIGMAYLIAERAVSVGGAISSLLLWVYLGGEGPSLFQDLCNPIPLFAFKYEAIGFEVLALVAAGLVCMGILAFLTSGYLPPADAFAGKEVLADEDVEEEKKRIASLRDKKNFSEHSMLAWSLHKRYGDFRAVRGLYVALKPSECFGLLGVNGAGKTTTFQMLAGLENVSYGDAMTKTATLSEGVRKNVLCYHLEERIPWSMLFSKLVKLQKDFELEHALVGENTLEQIFLSFAKGQGTAAQADTLAPPPAVIGTSPSAVSAAAASTAASTAKLAKDA